MPLLFSKAIEQKKKDIRMDVLFLVEISGILPLVVLRACRRSVANRALLRNARSFAGLPLKQKQPPLATVFVLVEISGIEPLTS